MLGSTGDPQPAARAGGCVARASGSHVDRGRHGCMALWALPCAGEAAPVAKAPGDEVLGGTVNAGDAPLEACLSQCLWFGWNTVTLT